MKKFFVILILFFSFFAFSGKDACAAQTIDELPEEAKMFINSSDYRMARYGLSQTDAMKGWRQLLMEGKIPDEILFELAEFEQALMEREAKLVDVVTLVQATIEGGIYFVSSGGNYDFYAGRDSIKEQIEFDRKNSREKDETYVKISEKQLEKIMDKEDIAFMKKRAKEIYTQETGMSQEEAFEKFNGPDVAYGFYATDYRDITLTELYYKLNDDRKVADEEVQIALHHEVQHAKDFYAAEKAGYAGYLRSREKADKMTYLLFDAVIEARAYVEEMVFAYQKIKTAEYRGDKEEREKWKNAFETAPTVVRKAFLDAVENHKTLEEARHIASTALLNSCHYIEYYLKRYEKGTWTGTSHVSLTDMISMLGDSKITDSDVYAAEKFWMQLCKDDDGKSDECRIAKIRFQRGKVCDEDKENRVAFCKKYNDMISKYIKVPNSASEDFNVDVVFKKMDKLFETDKTCTSEVCKDKGRILTTQEDEDFYNKHWRGVITNKDRFELCCTLDWDFSKWGSAKACD